MVERTVWKNPTAMVVSFRHRAGELGLGTLCTGNLKIPEGGIDVQSKTARSDSKWLLLLFNLSGLQK